MDRAPQELYDALYEEHDSADREVLRRNVQSLRMIGRDFSQYIDCVTSPLNRRLWWFLGGYHMRKVGRWYSKDTLMFKIWYFFAEKIHLT